MKVVIDRFEGEYAVCEKDDRTMVNIKKNSLPPDVEEGDVLIINGDTIIIDVAETRKRKRESRQLMDGLFESKED